MSTPVQLLIGEAANAELAGRIADQYAACPYVYFIAAFGRSLVGIWALPESRRWWLELVAEQPALTLGLERAAVYRADGAAYPGAFEPRMDVELGETAPCGSDCRECERYEICGHCPGCASYDPDRVGPADGG